MNSAAPTIYDVARAAGVSPSTVSRCFSRPGRVNAETAERIRDVADEIGYRPRTRPRTPARTLPRVLGLAVADITNPFNFRVVRGCQTAATQAGFVVALSDSPQSDELERESLRRMLPLLDGLIVVSSRLSDHELRTLAKTVPVVVLNRRVAGLHCLVPDVSQGVRKAAEHLCQLGHRTIAYAAGPEASWADQMRWRAVRDASRDLGFAECRIGPFAPTVTGGRAAAEVVAARRLRAVVCYNDLLAIGLVRGLAERGLCVGEDVSVVGYDNIFAAAVVTPALTTVAAPFTLLGEAAVRTLVGFVSGTPTAEHVSLAVPVRLVVRDSTGPA